MSEKFDCIIIGAGPAGIFTALELVKKDSLKVLLIEKGKDLEKRDRRFTNSGWGGSGSFSDGKLILSSEVGGWLSEYISPDRLESLISYVDSLYIEFGGASKRYGEDAEVWDELRTKAQKAEMTLLSVIVRHLGTDNCKKVLERIREHLGQKIDIRTDTEVNKILVKKNAVVGVRTADGEEIESKTVVAAPGRAGARWLSEQSKELKLRAIVNPVDLGLRIEVPAAIMEPLTKPLYESKLIYYSRLFDDKVRTFCMNPYGEVTIERYQDNLITVNGHSYANKKTDKTNFALLVSTNFTEPFKEPTAYGSYIARLANLLSGGIIIQRLGDLMIGRRSTVERIARSTVSPSLNEATPGDLSFVLPYRYISDILEMLEALDQMVPGIYSQNTLLYGVEAKFYSQRVILKSNLETEVDNLYTIGDGAGITRGLIQASISGIVVARSILNAC